MLSQEEAGCAKLLLITEPIDKLQEGQYQQNQQSIWLAQQQ